MDTDEGLKRGGVFAKPGRKGMEMQICTSKDRCIEPLSTGIPIGRLMARPKGNLPRANAAEFAYPMRKEKLKSMVNLTDPTSRCPRPSHTWNLSCSG